jgi:predicted LPLAT superfamily acyltransferase
VFSVFVVKVGIRDFRLILKPLKADGLQSLAQAYASALEQVARQYPDQWYNFYDFWAA